MSSHATAILFYGIAAAEHTEDWGNELWGMETDFAGDSEEFYAHLRGLNKPQEKLNALDYDVCTKYDAYWDKKKKLLEECPCEIHFHGDPDGATQPFVAVKKSMHQASCGERLHIEGIGMDTEWREQLLKYCKEMGIPWEEPRWWLVSQYF